MSKNQWPLPGTYYCPVCKGTNLIYDNNHWTCKDCHYFFPNEPPKVRKTKHIPTVVTIFLIILAICFVSGLTYMLLPATAKTTLKSNVSSFFVKSTHSSTSSTIAVHSTAATPLNRTPFYVVENYLSQGKYVALRVIDEWDGNGNKTIDFNLPDPPAVINFSCRSVNPLSSNFGITMQTGPTLGTIIAEDIHSGQTFSGTGKYRLVVNGAGYNWQILIGAY